MGRAIGVAANVIWDKALMYPIEKPKYLTTQMLENLVNKGFK
jgi:citrate synthase